jgi:hypothetical protein
VIFLVICILYYEYFNIVHKIQRNHIEKFASVEESLDNTNGVVESITSTLCENKKTFDVTNVDIVRKFNDLIGVINDNYENINKNLNDYHSTLISSKNNYSKQL